MKTSKATLNQDVENLGETLKQQFLYQGIQIPPTNYHSGR